MQGAGMWKVLQPRRAPQASHSFNPYPRETYVRLDILPWLVSLNRISHSPAYECSHPSCDKFFNRHDNLLQHLKVHKDLPASQGKDVSAREPSTHPADTEIVPPVRPPVIDAPPPSYPAFPLYHIRPTYTIDMAVSSLRTKIPHSPTEPASPVQDTIVRSSHHYRRSISPPPYFTKRPLLLPANNANRDDWQT